MEDSTPFGAAILIVASTILATGMLRRAWRMPNGHGGVWVAGGWALIVASIVWPAWWQGPVRGPVIAAALVSTAALVVVASGRVQRPARTRAGRESLAPEPSDRATTRWRETLRWLLAGPIGMIAAMAVGIAYAAPPPCGRRGAAT